MGIVSLLREFVGLMDIKVILVMLLATTLGVIIGALPGLSATMGIALLTGLTYTLPLEYIFAILMGIYVGGIYGGSISAILLNIPGTASAAATALEGHPLALQGKAESAIKLTRAASIFGTFIGVVALALIAPPLTLVALKFHSAEYFMLALFGVLICGTIVNSDLPVKGWIGGLIGLLISCIGIDKIYGASRFDMGVTQLMGGVDMIAAMIGFYAIPEVIKAFKRVQGNVAVEEIKSENKTNRIPIMKELIKNARVIVQSSLIGIGIGALPGVGEDVAAWVSYDTAKKTSKHPELYGKGSLEGIIAPEVGNNAAIGGATIPLLTLAVPGSPPAAVLLGAFMIHNIKPGPMIMTDNPTFIFYIAALILLAVICLWLVGMVIAKPMAMVLKVPTVYLMPIIAVLSVVGAYAINMRSFDIVVVFVFGVLGYFLDKMGYAAAPIVLGLILGKMIDENFRRALVVSSGDPSIFVTRPISLVFFLIILSMVFKTFVLKGKKLSSVFKKK